MHHRFVDVLHELPDARLMIDFTHFHDTVADVPSTVAR